MWTVRPLEPEDVVRVGLAEAWGSSGTDAHTVGAFDGPALLAGARLVPQRRTRRSHVGLVETTGRDGGALELVLDAIVRFADRWTPLDRLELAAAPDEPVAAVAATAGFVRETVRVDRRAPGRDEWGFGRLRPGFVPRPPGPPPPWPERAAARLPVTFSPVTDADAEAVARLSVEPSVVWGTLQSPTSNVAFYAHRARTTPPDVRVVCARAGGALAGQGAVLPTAFPDGWTVGMMVGREFQGAGVGGALLDELVRVAWAAGARRIELEVWSDNTRAVALYRSRGFVEEGCARFDGLRDGGHASSLEMALRRA
jgi:putative acetyltransferase